MSETPYMKLWVGDFVGDTLHLTRAEVGQYILLLMAMWKNGGSLPRDPKKLARIARGAISDAVMAFFDTDEEGVYQKRLRAELGCAQKKSIAAKQSAQTRWADKPLKDNDTGDANALPTQCYHSHSHSQSQKEEKKKETRASALDVGFESFWISYPHKVGKAAALKAYLAARKRGASSEEIVAGVERYRRFKPPDRPWCNPATFLNQDRWMDEPAKGPETVQQTAARLVRESEEKNGIALEWLESLDAGRSLEIRANPSECVPTLPAPGRPRGLREDAG